MALWGNGEDSASLDEQRKIYELAFNELLELREQMLKERLDFSLRRRESQSQKRYLTIPEVAERWRIARPTVYNRPRSAGIRVLDFADRGGRGRKLIAMGDVLRVEREMFRRI
jgi:hypothetical protein